MPDKIGDAPDLAALREKALSRWDSEGGATHHGSQAGLTAEGAGSDREPQLTNAELVQLRVRVIALENLVIALLAGGSNRQVGMAREVADYISPRPGFTQHRLTTRAAAHMIDLLWRAAHFRSPVIDERNSNRPAGPDG
jgi:hypothetical protein